MGKYSKDYVNWDLKNNWINMVQFFKNYAFRIYRTHEEYQKNCKRYTELVGSLLCGTDALLPFAVSGFSLHKELEQLVNGGLSPYEVLKTATCNPAEYLNIINEFGTIEVDKKQNWFYSMIIL